MSPYAAIVSARFRMLLQYRAAAAAGLGTQVFWGLIRVMILTAFYASTNAPQPMVLEDVITYVWLGQAFLRMLPWMPDREVADMIRTGNVAYELLRPVDLYHLWYSRTVANLTAPTVLRSVPMLVLAALFFGLEAPPSWACGLAWAAAMAGAVVLACALSVLLTVTLFWTLSGEGVSVLMVVAVWLFSGMTLPLPLFPDWAQGVLRLLPFSGLMDTPFRLYMGHIPPSELWAVAVHQLAWTAGLVLFTRWLLARGTRRLVVQGG